LTGRKDLAHRRREELEELRREGPGDEKENEDRRETDEDALAQLLQMLEKAHPREVVFPLAALRGLRQPAGNELAQAG
jgi:hypothetical protein